MADHLDQYLWRLRLQIMSQNLAFFPPVTKIMHKNPFSTSLWTSHCHELIPDTVNSISINGFYSTNIHFVVRQFCHRHLPIHSLRRNHWAYRVVILKMNMSHYLYLHPFYCSKLSIQKTSEAFWEKKSVFQSKSNTILCQLTMTWFGI